MRGKKGEGIGGRKEEDVKKNRKGGEEREMEKKKGRESQMQLTNWEREGKRGRRKRMKFTWRGKESSLESVLHQ